jgi:DNA-binding CsgD family transcriptional regulator
VRVLLTETELRVAELAADATEIDAIAAALGVGPAEAAGLLETVYRKLGAAGGA